eukprot:TRINITY_DN3698_c3_g1_i1.p1 TRINITY_DN3698_c3_g1~~TRINITY_DN3698_c3_g1_i1.p1  ORF type:complete len:328 (+),score=40.61 TRINITY_DN3698_c3_g1_i1:102-1085(+)
MLRFVLAVTLLLLQNEGVHSFGEASKYLIISAPQKGHISYLKLPDDGSPADGKEAPKVLIDSGLVFPQGVAVDAYRQRLFVADPNLGHLVMYPLSITRDLLVVGSQQIVARGVEVRAVSVDGLGNVVFTEEATNRIMKVSAAMIDAGNTKAKTLYDGKSLANLRAPGGIAADNYFVYWLNKQSGTTAGSVVRGRQHPSYSLLTTSNDNSTAANVSHTNVAVLSNNAQKCYGTCIGLGNLFYTDESKNLYGINRASTARHFPVVISSALQEPRGCAFDGANTVYVADKGRNAVYQFASNLGSNLVPNRPLSKALDMQGAFGVAIYTVV